jgi:hypothetical protein
MTPATAWCRVWQFFFTKRISPGKSNRRRQIVFNENNPVADPARDLAAA